MTTNTTACNIPKLPVSFIKNDGQVDEQAFFTAKSKGSSLFFCSDRITIVEQKAADEKESDAKQSSKLQTGVALNLCFIGANAGLVPQGVSVQPGRCHYFLGSDQAKWKTSVLLYDELCYPTVWPGIDLELSSSETELKMNWVLDRPERAASIWLRWDGADRLEIDEEGKLLVHHALGVLTDPMPFAYQEKGGEKVQVNCAYRLKGDMAFGFELDGAYEPDLPLVIDPVLTYATYLGGNGQDEGTCIAVDAQGCAYVAGYTASTDFPVTPGAFQTTLTGSLTAFVTKLAADGASLIYSSYLGGSGQTRGWGIAIDKSGYAYVVGDTNATDFPTTSGAFQETYSGTTSAGFITKFSVDGASLVFSSYLGATGFVLGYGVAVDAQDCAYVSGETEASDFPVTLGAFQPTLAGTVDAFVAKFTVDGASLMYATYLGGSQENRCTCIAVDAQGYAYVAGYTNANDFPVTPGSFQTTYNGNTDMYVTKFASNGQSLIYSTYLGGTGNDRGQAIALDASGSAYVTGIVDSTDFPVTPGAFQTTLTGTRSAAISRLSLGGDQLIASTYLGGSADDYGYGIAVDAQGRAYVTGLTASGDFPITPSVIPSSYNGGNDAFISVLPATLSSLLVSYFLGGSSFDTGEGIALERGGIIYSTGYTSSSNFPVTPGAFQSVYGGGSDDAYVTKNTFVFYGNASITIQKLGV